MTALQLATLQVARTTRKRNDLESQHQRALVEWAGLTALPSHLIGYEPGDKVGHFLFAIPNGGARSKATAGKLKAEGVKAGVWDLMLAIPVGRHHGLWIEMKAGKNTLTDEQKTWRQRMVRMRYHCVPCWSWEEAQAAILAYLGTPSRVLAALDDAEEGELANPKHKAVRSEKYRRLVASLPCICCGAEGYSQAAHPNTGKGMGQKADDNLCFPLCGPHQDLAGMTPGCHASFDQGAMFDKQTRRAKEVEWGAQTVQRITRMGKWPMGLPKPRF